MGQQCPLSGFNKRVALHYTSAGLYPCRYNNREIFQHYISLIKWRNRTRVVELEPKQFWMVEASNSEMVDPEPDIWVPVPQP